MDTQTKIVEMLISAKTSPIALDRLFRYVGPVYEILTKIDDFNRQGRAQFNFQYLNNACNSLKEFSEVLDMIRNIELNSNHPIELKLLIRRVVPYSTLVKDISKYISALPGEIVSAWKDSRDITPMEKCIKSITDGHLHELGTHISGIEECNDEILQQCMEIYENILQATEDALNAGKSFNKYFADLKKFETIEQVLGLTGVEDIKRRASSLIGELVKEADTFSSDIPRVAKCLTDLQYIAEECPFFGPQVKSAIEAILDSNYKNVDALGIILLDLKSRYANILISSYPLFAAITANLWLRRTARESLISKFEIETLLFESRSKFLFRCISSKSSNEISYESRRSFEWAFFKFERTFRDIIQENKSTPNFNAIATKTQQLNRERGENLPEILAHVLAVWSLVKSNVTTKSKRTARDFYQPHEVQVVTLMLMLESKNRRYINQLAHVFPGEGKSIILGTLSTVIALTGKKVFCVSYSSYLSKQDYQKFLPIFEIFGVKDLIRYSTLTDLCDCIINSEGNVRDLTRSFLNGNLVQQLQQIRTTTYGELEKSVLLIDEADVLFGADYPGDTYRAATRIQSKDVYNLMKFIWSNQGARLHEVEQTQAYKSTMNKSSLWEDLIRSQVKQMLSEVKEFRYGNPFVVNDRVEYAEKDNTSFSIAYGYRTAFAYYYFYDSGDITEESLKRNVGINIICDEFAYADIPKKFKFVMGVSSSLSDLNEVEKQILHESCIARVVLAPSIFRRQSGTIDVLVIRDREKLLLEIKNRAQTEIKLKKAVIVVFAAETMKDFINLYNSKFDDFNVLNEHSEHWENIIASATKSGMMTVIERSCVRGSKFSHEEDQTNHKGVHVIQTFVGESTAEDIRIQGIYATAGFPVSHQAILWEEEVAELTEGKISAKNASPYGNPYKRICYGRDKSNSVMHGELKECETKPMHANFHQAFLNYKKSLNADKIIQRRIFNMNQKLNDISHHLYFCLDDSVSERNEWNSLIKIVKDICDQRIQMCHTGDLVTIVNFRNDSQVMCASVPITSQPHKLTKFRSGLTDKLSPNKVSVGLNRVAQEMENLQNGYLPVLVFISDRASHSGVAEIREISENLKDRGIDIFIGSTCRYSRTLQYMAKVSGGQSFLITDNFPVATKIRPLNEKKSKRILHIT